MTEYISFTPEKLRQFKRDYEKAVKEGKETFTFEDRELLTTYAKYMIEYVKDRLNI